MLIWNAILYTLGVGLALRSLLSLMAQHRQQYERKLRRELKLEAKRAQEAAKKEENPAVPSSVNPSAA